MIKAAAIKLKSGEVRTLPPPSRHHSIMLGMHKDEFPGHVQGFIDADGNFLTREAAWKIADAHGQIIIDEGRTYWGELYTEDLW